MKKIFIAATFIFSCNYSSAAARDQIIKKRLFEQIIMTRTIYEPDQAGQKTINHTIELPGTGKFYTFVTQESDLSKTFLIDNSDNSSKLASVSYKCLEIAFNTRLKMTAAG